MLLSAEEGSAICANFDKLISLPEKPAPRQECFGYDQVTFSLILDRQLSGDKWSLAHRNGCLTNRNAAV
jgi:hypothetical protein